MFNEKGSLVIDITEYRTEDVNTIKMNYGFRHNGTTLILTKFVWQPTSESEQTENQTHRFTTHEHNGTFTWSFKDGTKITSGRMGVWVITRDGSHYSPY